MLAGLWALQRFTSFGLRLRATALDPMAAGLVGVNTNTTSMATWALAGGLAGLSGILIAPSVAFSVFFMTSLLLRSVAAALVGGLTSISGAVIAGICLGVAEGVIGYVMPVQRHRRGRHRRVRDRAAARPTIGHRAVGVLMRRALLVAAVVFASLGIVRAPAQAAEPVDVQAWARMSPVPTFRPQADRVYVAVEHGVDAARAFVHVDLGAIPTDVADDVVLRLRLDRAASKKTDGVNVLACPLTTPIVGSGEISAAEAPRMTAVGRRHWSAAAMARGWSTSTRCWAAGVGSATSASRWSR